MSFDLRKKKFFQVEIEDPLAIEALPVKKLFSTLEFTMKFKSASLTLATTVTRSNEQKNTKFMIQNRLEKSHHWG